MDFNIGIFVSRPFVVSEEKNKASVWIV